MTYMLLLNCALKLVEEIILYYDARSKKHKKKELKSWYSVIGSRIVEFFDGFLQCTPTQSSEL